MNDKPKERKGLIKEKHGRIVKGLGGLYEVRIDGGEVISCRAKGNLKRDEEKLFVGDRVTVLIDETTPDGKVISALEERKNSLIRPPIANLDLLFIVFAAAKPAPVLETVDKLVSIAVHNNITPVIVVTKCDLADEYAAELLEIYKGAGISAFVTSSKTGEGKAELCEFVYRNVSCGRVASFAGASGVGKSTLMNLLFPELSLATSEISRKIERGKHTTRHVELFPISSSDGEGFLADTPGFSLVDFERFDFMKLEDLLPTYREFSEYIGKCRYADCAHVGEGEDECAIARAVRDGKISKSRLDSYRSIYSVLKNKTIY